MNNRNAAGPDMDDFQDALRPLASLIGKSEKAQQKLAPGTWQRTMLRDNLRALRLASALMNPEAGGTVRFARADGQEALRALAAMIGRTEKAWTKFPPGTSQHTLLRNRIRALRIAEALIRAELEKRPVPEKARRRKNRAGPAVANSRRRGAPPA